LHIINKIDFSALHLLVIIFALLFSLKRLFYSMKIPIF